MILRELHLQTRTQNTLERNGIWDTDELAAWSEEQLRALPNFGAISVNDVRIQLQRAQLPALKIRHEPTIVCPHCGEPISLDASPELTPSE